MLWIRMFSFGLSSDIYLAFLPVIVSCYSIFLLHNRWGLVCKITYIPIIAMLIHCLACYELFYSTMKGQLQKTTLDKNSCLDLHISYFKYVFSSILPSIQQFDWQFLATGPPKNKKNKRLLSFRYCFRYVTGAIKTKCSVHAFHSIYNWSAILTFHFSKEV